MVLHQEHDLESSSGTNLFSTRSGESYLSSAIDEALDMYRSREEQTLTEQKPSQDQPRSSALLSSGAPQWKVWTNYFSRPRHVFAIERWSLFYGYKNRIVDQGMRCRKTSGFCYHWDAGLGRKRFRFWNFNLRDGLGPNRTELGRTNNRRSQKQSGWSE